MPISEFLRRFLVHTGIALGLWYAAMVTVEKLIPGFVTPFVDLAQAGLVTLAVSGLAVFLVKGLHSRWHMFMSTLVFYVLLAASLVYLFTRLNDQGWAGYTLFGAAVVVALLAYYELWMDRSAE